MSVFSEDDARLVLFSAIEGGQAFWSREIKEKGAVDVYARLISEGYDINKYAKVIAKAQSADLKDIKARISLSKAIFLTPSSDEWPTSLNDLAAIPIGLVVKGDVASLSQRSLAIVGTRNPTSYGMRIAGERVLMWLIRPAM